MVGAATNPVLGRSVQATVSTNFYQAFLAITNPVGTRCSAIESRSRIYLRHRYSLMLVREKFFVFSFILTQLTGHFMYLQFFFDAFVVFLIIFSRCNKVLHTNI